MELIAFFSLTAFAALLFPSVPSGLSNPPDKAVFELAGDDVSSIPPDGVVKACSAVLSMTPTPSSDIVADALRRRGNAYLQLRKAAAANEDFNKLCKIKPKDADARCRHALALGDLDRLDDAFNEVSAAIRLCPDKPAPYTVLASLFFVQGHVDDAIAGAKKSIDLDKQFPMAYYILGLSYYRKGDAVQCLENLGRFLQLRPLPSLPDPDRPYFIRGLVFTETNRPYEAINNFQMARKLNPMSANAAWGICVTYGQLDKWHLAWLFGKECIRLDPNSSQSHLAFAFACARIGKKKDAMISGRKALDLARPANAELLGEIGRVSFQVGQYGDALDYYNKALKLDPHCVAATIGMISLLANCSEDKYRDGAEALSIARKAVKYKWFAAREKWHVLMLMAEAHAECGHFRDAISYCDRALELVPDEYAERKKEISTKRLGFQKGKPYRYLPPDNE